MGNLASDGHRPILPAGSLSRRERHIGRCFALLETFAVNGVLTLSLGKEQQRGERSHEAEATRVSFTPWQLGPNGYFPRDR